MRSNFFREHREYFERFRLDTTREFQVQKLVEEVGEVMAALCRRDLLALEDGIGDVIIATCSLARVCNLDPHKALNEAWKRVRERSVRRGMHQSEEG